MDSPTLQTLHPILLLTPPQEILPRDSLLALLCSIVARLALDDQIAAQLRQQNGVLLLGRLLTTPGLDGKVRERERVREWSCVAAASGTPMHGRASAHPAWRVSTPAGRKLVPF
jgi:hypothetical protein